MDELAKQAQLLGLADIDRLREFTRLFMLENNIDEINIGNLLTEFNGVIGNFNLSYHNLWNVILEMKEKKYINNVSDIFTEEMMKIEKVRIAVRRYLKGLTMLSSMNNSIVCNYDSHSEFVKSLVVNFDLSHKPWIEYPNELNYSSKSTQEFDIELVLLIEMLKNEEKETSMELNLDELSERTGFRVVELVLAINRLKVKHVIFGYEQRKHIMSVWIRKELR